MCWKYTFKSCEIIRISGSSDPILHFFSFKASNEQSLVNFWHGHSAVVTSYIAGVDVEWPFMKVIITFSFCCDHLWKSKFMALEKPGKLRDFSPTLWPPCTSDCPSLRHNFEIRNNVLYKSCNSWNNENISMKLSGTVKNFRYKSWNFGKKSLSVVEKLHFIQWDIFEPPGIYGIISRTLAWLGLTLAGSMRSKRDELPHIYNLAFSAKYSFIRRPGWHIR